MAGILPCAQPLVLSSAVLSMESMRQVFQHSTATDERVENW